MKLQIVFFIFFGLLLSACSSSQLIRDQEYRDSLNLAQTNHFDKALAHFPKKENGGFITSVEKAWLTFWSLSDQEMQNESGQQILRTRLTDLQKQVATFEARKFISISRESEYFLFQESEDGYVPSEPEIAILHLLSAQFYIKLKQIEDAKVEIRRANFILQAAYDIHENHFDDASLRLWSGALWLAVDDWEEAQVDFRRAAQLSGSDRMKHLSQLKRPPSKLELVFSGVSPELKWDNSSWQPEFIRQDQPPLMSYAIHLSTYPWYEQQTTRNTKLRDLILESNYMAQFASTKIASNSERIGSHALTTSMKILAVGVGVGTVAATAYLAGISSGEGLMSLLTFGFGASAVIWHQSNKLGEHLGQVIDKSEKDDIDSRRSYRFVRFLPNWISAAWTENGQELDHPLLILNDRDHELSGPPPRPSTVIFGFRQ